MSELVNDYNIYNVSIVSNPTDPSCVIQWPLKKVCEKIVKQKCEEFIKNKFPKLTKYQWMNIYIG